MFSSELEEVYQQFSKWLANPIIETEKGTKRELDSRELAVVHFAGSLLKRTLSESFAGVPLSEGCPPAPDVNEDYEVPKKNKLVLNAKSLSLELARHKHRLAAQLVMICILNFCKEFLKNWQFLAIGTLAETKERTKTYFDRQLGLWQIENGRSST